MAGTGGRTRRLPDAAARGLVGHRVAEVRAKGKNLLVAHMPYKVRVHTVVNDVLQPWVRGYWRHPFMRDTWVYAGVDEEMRR